MTINYDNIHQAIAALNQCAKENENRQTDTGSVRVSDLCTDVACFLCKVRQDHKQWQETKDGKMHVYLFHDNDDDGQIADLWTTSVPDIGEQMILWDKGEHHHYEVTRRIYGANAEEKVGVWNLYVEAFFKKHNEEVLAKMNLEDYNGGISVIDFGLMKQPLPVPEKGMKWAMRWHDTPSGELLPELTQVPVGESNSEWREGYPKYE